MWDYTEKVMDHFRNPRNVGKLENPDGVGEVGSLSCGDSLKLMFTLDENDRIKDASFQTFGCGSAIASSSALTEIIKGMTLEEAAKVTNQDIVDYLGELPEAKMHCSVMGSEALEAAIINYRTGGTAPPHTEERIICKCFGVTQETIERTIAEHNLTTVEEVTNYTKAGGACGTCQPDIEELLSAHSENREPSSPDESTAKKRLTNIEKIKLIQETIEREIRPELRKDGGDIELVDVVGNEVLVSMRGNCAGCQVAEFTLSKVVEQKLREFVSPELVVVEEK